MQYKPYSQNHIPAAKADVMQAVPSRPLSSLLLVILLIAALLFSGFAAPPITAAAQVDGIASAPQATLLSADARGLTVAFAFNESQLRLETAKQTDAKGQACQQIGLVGGVNMDQAGLPDLPLFSKLVGLPPSGKVALSVSSLDAVTLPGTYHLCPGLDRGTEIDADGTPRYVERHVVPDAAIYDGSQPFPDEIGAFADLGFMRSQRMGRIQLSPVQFNPATGEIVLHRQILVTLSFDGAFADKLEGRLGALAGQAVVEPTAFEDTFASTLLNYDQAQSWRAQPGQTAALSAALANRGGEAQAALWTPPSPAYRVTVNEAGIHKLTRSDLAGAGLPVDSLDPRTLRLYNQGSQVAINVTGQSDGKFDASDMLIFYGQAVDTPYTDTNVYWLTYGGSTGLRMQSASVDGSGTPVGSYTETVRFERNLNYVSTLPKLEGYDHWYDVSITALTSNTGQHIPGTTFFSMPVSDKAQDPFTATLTVKLGSISFGQHHLFLLVNDQQVGEFDWNHRNLHEVMAQVPSTLLVAGNNKITVRNSTDLSNLVVDTIYIDWLTLDYQRQLKAKGNQLAFADAQVGSWSYEVGGFSGSDVAVYDITTPGQVAMVPATVSGGTVSFVRTTATARSYVAVEAGQMRSPVAIGAANVTSLAGTGAGADYIIISPADFLTAIEPLATYRASQNMRVRTVDVQDIYDQFGYGLPSAEAIRDFLSYAYTNWPGTAPSYVLLVGDGTYDMRRYGGQNVSQTYIPPFLAMVDPDLGETATDNRFAMLTGDDLLADMYIGRFPVNSTAEVDVMVQKTLNYETSAPSGDWQTRALFITDDLSNGGGAFYAFSNEVADGTVDGTPDTPLLLPEEFERIKIYMASEDYQWMDGACNRESPSVACRNRIAQAINEGVSIVSYVGHGTKQAWAEEKLYDESLVNGLNNGDKQPVILAMTCQEGYFQLPTLSALAEASVRISGKGAVASWSPTGFGLATGHDLLEKGFMLAVFHEGATQLGPATQRGKLNLYQNAPVNRYDDLMDTFVLFGDPALRFVAVPQAGEIFLPMLNR